MSGQPIPAETSAAKAARRLGGICFELERHLIPDLQMGDLLVAPSLGDQRTVQRARSIMESCLEDLRKAAALLERVDR